MMTKLREMTFIFIWILVIAFVGLMVFEWGMDISGLKGRSNIIGKINGNKITIQEFQQGVQNQYLQEKQTAGADLDENRLAQIRDEVWEQFIKRILFAKEINKRGITVTDGEIFTYITQNPQLLPPAISQNENFMTDGKFDMEKYQQALNNPQNDWTPVENYIREVMPFQISICTYICF
jgi:peptidyl-prolyl cis-trans isomerase D